MGGTLHAALEAAGIDLLIFDMDGVLVDVADSYRTTVALAVEIYVRDVARLPAPGSISSQLVSAWKGAGGFNNDWDLTAAIAGAVICKDGDLGAVVALANDVGAEGGGLAGLEAVLGRVATAAVRYSGDVGDPYDIKRIFQELYLGGPRFKASTGLLPAHVGLDAPGLCDREFEILSAAVCQALAARMPLAIATGRPADEAYEALTRMGLRAHFGAVVTDDDVRAESRRSGLAFADLAKPAPWPLQEAHRRAAPDAQHPAYVGDLPDDMTAARAAGMFSVGIGSPTPPAGAELALSHPDLLMEISGS